MTNFQERGSHVGPCTRREDTRLRRMAVSARTEVEVRSSLRTSAPVPRPKRHLTQIGGGARRRRLEKIASREPGMPPEVILNAE